MVVIVCQWHSISTSTGLHTARQIRLCEKSYMIGITLQGVQDVHHLRWLTM